MRMKNRVWVPLTDEERKNTIQAPGLVGLVYDGIVHQVTLGGSDPIRNLTGPVSAQPWETRGAT